MSSSSTQTSSSSTSQNTMSASSPSFTPMRQCPNWLLFGLGGGQFPYVESPVGFLRSRGIWLPRWFYNPSSKISCCFLCFKWRNDTVIEYKNFHSYLQNLERTDNKQARNCTKNYCRVIKGLPEKVNSRIRFEGLTMTIIRSEWWT